MRVAPMAGCILWIAGTQWLAAQEASSGLDVRATLTAQTAASNELSMKPRSGVSMILGSRAVLYPTLKLSENWTVTSALQITTRPYYYEDFSTPGYGAKGMVLQATVNYARVSDKGSLLARAGQMSSAFGSFLLRYDDADNSLVDLPLQYGYYYAPVSIEGVAGAQVDGTRGKWDGRVQFANSSPANPRSVFARDQYGNWAGGAGYTIRQGFRVGVSGYHGPYLSRDYAYFFPGEAHPNTLPAHAIGVDANWAHGHTTAYCEVSRFVMPYKAIPTFREGAGYTEIRQVLSPRWYVAGRYGLTSNDAAGRTHAIEAAAGFRPTRRTLAKLDYEERLYGRPSGEHGHYLGIQLITTLDRSFGKR